MSKNSKRSTHFYLIVVSTAVILLFFVLLIGSALLMSRVQEPQKGSVTESYDNESFYVSSEVIDNYEEASQTFAETSYSDESFVDQSEEQSLTSSDNENNDNNEHGWVINQYGYTYLYGDCGYEQFNYKNSSMERYINCINGFESLLSNKSNYYNIIVPISSTFANIPREIYKNDNFYNQSQSSFVATVSDRLNESIVNIPIVSVLEEKYDNGEYVYYRTDKNWTSLGAYYSYDAFCEASGLQAFPLEYFTVKDVGDFLGSFYNATSSTAMANNPDSMICYTQPISTSITIYDDQKIYTDYNLCDNKVNTNNAYDFYLGREAARYEICTAQGGGSLLIIGDTSVNAILPYLVCHYNKIDYINPQYYKNTLKDFFTDHDYDDIITMCYSTSAVSGEYVPSLNTIIGEIQNVE